MGFESTYVHTYIHTRRHTADKHRQAGRQPYRQTARQTDKRTYIDGDIHRCRNSLRLRHRRRCIPVGPTYQHTYRRTSNQPDVQLHWVCTVGAYTTRHITVVLSCDHMVTTTNIVRFIFSLYMYREKREKRDRERRKRSIERYRERWGERERRYI